MIIVPSYSVLLLSKNFFESCYSTIFFNGYGKVGNDLDEEKKIFKFLLLLFWIQSFAALIHYCIVDSSILNTAGLSEKQRKCLYNKEAFKND